jgi:hypothetical protein
MIRLWGLQGARISSLGGRLNASDRSRIVATAKVSGELELRSIRTQSQNRRGKFRSHAFSRALRFTTAGRTMDQPSSRTAALQEQ